MRKAVMWRLLALEAQQGKKIPTFADFRTQWGQMDALSKSLYLEICANPQNFKHEGRRQRAFLGAIRQHLQKMGVLDEQTHESFFALAQRLDRLEGEG